MNAPFRRRKPRTVVGKLVRAWPKVRLALRFLRFVRRTRRALRIAALSLAGAVVLSLVRRLRRRREVTSGPTTYSPPPASPVGYSGGTRETGYEAGPGTRTERELLAEKVASNGTASPTQTEEPPPVEQEPPTTS
jgi:hypothetical protein